MKLRPRKRRYKLPYLKVRYSTESMFWVKIQWDMRNFIPHQRVQILKDITENFPLLTLIMWTIGSDTALRKFQINNNVKKSKQTKHLAWSNRTEHNFIYFRPSSLSACVVYYLISAAELMVDYSIGSSLFLTEMLNKIVAFATLEVYNKN